MYLFGETYSPKPAAKKVRPGSALSPSSCGIMLSRSSADAIARRTRASERADEEVFILSASEVCPVLLSRENRSS